MSVQVTPPVIGPARWVAPGQAELTWTPTIDTNASGYHANGSIDGGKTWISVGKFVEGRSASSTVIVGLDDSKDWKFAMRSVAGGPRSASTSLPSSAIAPLDLSPPVLSPLPAIVGHTLFCSPGTWTGSPSFIYQWLRDGTAFTTGASYVPQAADQGHQLSCRVTATNAGGSLSATSEAVSIPPAPVEEPSKPPAGVIWAMDGSHGGPTNDMWMESVSVVAQGTELGPGIRIVERMDAEDGGHLPPFGHKFLIRFEMGDGGPLATYFQDRCEAIMESVAQYGRNECLAPESAKWWFNGDVRHLTMAFYFPRFLKEVIGSLDPTGAIPLWQLHEPGGGTAHDGMKVRGTNASYYPVPRVTAEHNSQDLWQETQGAQAGVWYKTYEKIVVGSSGMVETWADRGDGQGLVKRGVLTGIDTLGAGGKVFPCLGGPRNEQKTTPMPCAHQRWYYAPGLVQADSREAATLAAFAASL